MQFKIRDNILAKCVDKSGRCIYQAAKILKITSKGINIKYQDGYNRINVPYKEIRKAPTLENIVSLKEIMQTPMASPSQQTSSTNHLPPSISHQASPSQKTTTVQSNCAGKTIDTNTNVFNSTAINDINNKNQNLENTKKGKHN